jgi:hypothetical protein
LRGEDLKPDKNLYTNIYNNSPCETKHTYN